MIIAGNILASVFGQNEEESTWEIKRLESPSLRRTCDAALWAEKSSNDFSNGTPLLGQDRAAEALNLAATMRHSGYNVFALSPIEAGNIPAIESHLETLALEKRTPSDWVYVFNFEEPRHPLAIKLKPGQGPCLRAGLWEAVHGLRIVIPKIFVSPEYQAYVKDVDREADELVQALQDKADALNMTIITTEDGFKIVPLKEGRQMTEAELEALPREERRRMDILIEQLQEELEEIISRLPEWERASDDKRAELNAKLCREAILRALAETRQEFGGEAKLDQYFDNLEVDLLENIELFVTDHDDLPSLVQLAGGHSTAFMRYDVKVIVSQEDRIGSPVVRETNPTYGRLVGSIKPSGDLIGPAHDHTSIEQGSLHKAIDGFLILEVEELLTMPLAWDVIKRTLRDNTITVDAPGDWYGDYGGEGLDPEPIPFGGKVILIGDRYIHHRLTVLDLEFSGLFKILADFAEDMPRTDGNDREYAGMLSGLVRRENLRAFSAGALGRLVEQSARLAEDAEKLSLLMTPLLDLMIEADHVATQHHHELVMQEDVDEAVESSNRRRDQMRERSHEYVLRDILHVETIGEKIGQMNGLVVTGLDQAFGRPSRITARVTLGDGGAVGSTSVIDIQKEVELGGSSHSKGVMILSSFLRARYCPFKPFALSATLVFEQSYSFVDGDSASCAELCTLISAIAKIPLKQNLAMTGALSQHGEVMAIGGVNEKIEGFFDICVARGLSGEQGVVIPAANLSDLMLRQDIVEACSKGRFAIYAISTLDEALQLMTGLPAGERRKNGLFPKGSVNREVEESLERYDEMRRHALRPWTSKKVK